MNGKSNKKKVLIGIGIAVAALIVIAVIAYNVVRSVGKSSLLNKDVIQEFDERYERLIDVNIHQKVSTDDIYEVLAAEDTDMIANVSTNRNYDLIYNHKKYKYNNKIINLLLLGTDSKDPVRERGANSEGIMVDGCQSDAIYLISIDTANKKMWFVQVPRDSVAYIDIYKEDGSIYSTMYEQITLQHASGNGLKQSNDRTGLAVSRMLYGLPLHSVTSVNMGGMVAVNDAIGGITVKSLYTFTGEQTHFEKDQEYHLEGWAAYDYVHYRDITRFNTSSERLARQMQYINCFFDQAWDSFTHKPSIALDAYNAAKDYIVTDLTTSEILTVATEVAGCSYQGMYELEGTVRAGQQAGETEHFDLDQEKLKEYLINTYYTEVK